MHGIIFERSAAELGTQPAGMMMMMMMMPGSACDAPQPKRKKVSEPTESMKRRLAEHGDPRWPHVNFKRVDKRTTTKGVLLISVPECLEVPRKEATDR